jgi:hypothetical protein
MSSYCGYCGQELRGLRFKVGDKVLFESYEGGLVESIVAKILPSRRYRVQYSYDCDGSVHYNSVMREEACLFVSEQEYLEVMEQRATKTVADLLEEIDELEESIQQGTLVKERYKEQNAAKNC